MNETTHRIYFDDPYQAEFQAKVLKFLQYDERPAVILEKTCFYPESGGQPYDTGSIEDAEVVEVWEQEGAVIHVLSREISGKLVRGRIDWPRRFDHMQQHAGQHILSQCFHSLLDGATRSFHLGEVSSTLEIGITEISPQEWEQVEGEANAVVYQDRPIKTYFVSDQDISGVPLRKPPQKTGRLRVVEVDGFDYSACGGTHPRRTGEIGMIKILRYEKIRNNLRFEFLCGDRARRDYFRKHRTIEQAAARFSCREDEVFSAIDKLLAEVKQSKRDQRLLGERIAQLEAEEMIRSADSAIISRVFQDREIFELRALALNIIRSAERVVLFGARVGERGYLLLARSEGIETDLRELIPVLTPLISGKGGGRPSLVELAGQNPDHLEKALAEARTFIMTKVPSLEE